MIAAKIMATKVETLTVDHTIADALKIIWEKRIRQLPVVDENKKVLGLVTPRLLLRSILPGYISKGYLKDVKFAPELTQFVQNLDMLAEKKIGDIINHDFCIVSPETSSMEVAALFINEEKHVECIMVADNMDRILGIISPVDVFKRICEFEEEK
ncbi:MAG: CBS domain-containing protein [Deltaproteobacteria bacterium]|nr:CBS domain-containing protein [Deltaproteobacteria bacterium]